MTGPVRPLDPVEVWWLRISEDAECYPAIREGLNRDERERAERFHFDRDRNAFALMRLLLRQLLAQRLATTAQGVQFEYGEHGKPMVAGGPGFNISHASGWGVCAIDPLSPVGVDVERLDRPRGGDRLELARRFFPPPEVAQMEGLEGDALESSFISCWCRKEAYVKRHGRGLSLPLDQFVVDPSPTPQGAILLATGWNRDDLHQSEITDLEPPPGCRAAICHQRGRRLSIYPSEVSEAVLAGSPPPRAG